MGSVVISLLTLSSYLEIDEKQHSVVKREISFDLWCYSLQDSGKGTCTLVRCHVPWLVRHIAPRPD